MKKLVSVLFVILLVLILSAFFRMTGFSVSDENQTIDNQTTNNSGFQVSGGDSGNNTFSAQSHPICPVVINSDTTLSADNNTGTCFYINASNIVFNCAGHFLSGNSMDDIFVITSKNNVTIRNCKMYDSSIPIFINESSNVIVYNNTINYSNLNFGIKIYSSVKDQGTGNNISSNVMIGGTDGISVGSERNIIENNQINGSSSLDGYGIYVYNDVINLSGNSFYGNKVLKYNYGFYSDGFDVNIFNFTIDNDEYYNGTYGIYLYQTGSSVNNKPIIKNSRIYNVLNEGVYLESSLASLENLNLSRNNFGGSNSGLLADSGSSIWLVNGLFNDSKKFGMLMNSPISANWTISDLTKCNNNNLSINGNITFNGGSLQLNNCFLVLNGVVVDGSGYANFTSLDAINKSVVAGEQTEFNFSVGTGLRMYIVLAGNVTTAMSVSSVNLSSAPDNLSSLKGVDIAVDNNTERNLTWAYLKLFYNNTEIESSNLNESTLQIYFYNTTSGNWSLEQNQGVDTTNNYVWANVTHLSTFAAFGNVSTSSNNGGSVSSGSGGSDVISEDLAYANPTIAEEQILAGYTNSFAIGGGVSFILGGESHSIEIAEIGENNIIFILASTPQNVTLLIGEERKFDLNNDGKYDLSVKLNSIDSQKKTANISILEISESTPLEKNTLLPITRGAVNPLGYMGIIILATLMVIALIIFIIIKLFRNRNN